MNTALTQPGAPMKVRGIQKRFGAFTALDNVSLDVAAGELVCLLGPSGCGKTTLLRCIAGLERQDSGELYLGSRDVSLLPPQARDYGILFQSYALFPNLTVEANIGYGLTGSGRDEVRKRVGQMLELVGLVGSEKSTPANSPAVNSNASPWPVRWRPHRRCCCWTSRCRPSTPVCASICAPSCVSCSGAWASPR